MLEPLRLVITTSLKMIKMSWDQLGAMFFEILKAILFHTGMEFCADIM